MKRSDGLSMILSYLRDLKDMIHVLRDLLIWRPGDLLLLLKKFFNSILYEDPLHVEYHNRSRWVWKMGLPLKTISICAVFSLQQFARKYKFRKTKKYLIDRTDWLFKVSGKFYELKLMQIHWLCHRHLIQDAEGRQQQ